MITPEKPLLNDKTAAMIVAPDGTVASFPTIVISHEDAKLLRAYKKWLLRNGYREALYCNQCYSANRSDGLEAYVTDERMLFKCRCRAQYYQGATP